MKKITIEIIPRGGATPPHIVFSAGLHRAVYDITDTEFRAAGVKSFYMLLEAMIKRIPGK